MALLSAYNGFEVIGTLRDLHTAPDALKKHPAIRLVEMQLDSDEAIEKGYHEISSMIGPEGLFALINNAGLVEPGPLGYILPDDFKYVYQINVFAPLKLIQLSLNHLQAFGKGARIINMSSISGLFASPFLGAYASSKFALEGLSDSLRRELNLLGIHVIKMNPGGLRTGIWRKQLEVIQKYPENPFSPFLEHAQSIIFTMEAQSIPVEAINAPFLDAMLSDQPKTSYLIHRKKFLFQLLTKYLPVNFVDRLILQKLKQSNKNIRPF